MVVLHEFLLLLANGVVPTRLLLGRTSFKMRMDFLTNYYSNFRGHSNVTPLFRPSVYKAQRYLPTALEMIIVRPRALLMSEKGKLDASLL